VAGAEKDVVEDRGEDGGADRRADDSPNERFSQSHFNASRLVARLATGHNTLD